MSGSIVPHRPKLATLRLKPTWVNRAGRVDRSACLEVRASEVKSLVEMRLVKRGGQPRPRTSKRVEPHLEAIGEIEVTGRLLAKLHARRLPFALSGDGRTEKSNAMKDPEQHNTRAHAAGWTNIWHFNPNRGASQTKLLGFFAEPIFMSGWSQRVRLVRWRLHERLAQHFLICPLCANKFRKLFAALCSKQELEDAATAEAWIEMVEARHAVVGRPLDARTLRVRAKLIDRYALLFRNRRLMCRTCLGMRYGEVRAKDAQHEEKCFLEEQREAEAKEREEARKAKQREYNREYREDLKEGLPHLERSMKALAQSQKKVESLKRMKL